MPELLGSCLHEMTKLGGVTDKCSPMQRVLDRLGRGQRGVNLIKFNKRICKDPDLGRNKPVCQYMLDGN